MTHAALLALLIFAQDKAKSDFLDAVKNMESGGTYVSAFRKK